MALEIIIVSLIGLIVVGLFVTGLCFFTYKVTTFSVVYSKIAFAMLFAYTHPMRYFVANGFLNFLIWFVIYGGIIFLLSLLPKVNVAIKFLCTVFMSYLVVSILLAIFSELAKSNCLWNTLAGEIVIKILCVGISMFFTYIEYISNVSSIFSNKVMIIIERILTSVVSSVALSFVFAPWYENYDMSSVALILLFAGATIGAYVGDYFMSEKG